jgi:hypothetical protein
MRIGYPTAALLLLSSAANADLSPPKPGKDGKAQPQPPRDAQPDKRPTNGKDQGKPGGKKPDYDQVDGYIGRRVSLPTGNVVVADASGDLHFHPHGPDEPCRRTS